MKKISVYWGNPDGMIKYHPVNNKLGLNEGFTVGGTPQERKKWLEQFNLDYRLRDLEVDEETFIAMMLTVNHITPKIYE